MKANENQSAARKALLLRGWEALCQPLVAIIFGLVVGAVVILACGQNPMAVYAELRYGHRYVMAGRLHQSGR